MKKFSAKFPNIGEAASKIIEADSKSFKLI